MIGDVLRPGDPEPDEGTFLLDAKGHVEIYHCAEFGGWWDRYVAKMGPFVVAPDYDAAIAEDGAPATDVPPTPPIVTCMECGASDSETLDWLIEDVPTIGGGLIAVRLCFDCRGLAAWPVPERRDGSCDRWYCDGEHEGLDVWHAFCGSCERGWSCWDEHCVREWAGQHDDEGCDIYINPPEAREFR